MAPKSKIQYETEMSLPPDLRPLFSQLIEDYRSSATARVPDYKGGGISFNIAADLVRWGWRKVPQSN